jgi:hypothetical protein
MVLQNVYYYTTLVPGSEFKSVVNVYWHGEGAAGLSCTELSIWEFPSLRGGSRQWGNSTYMILCEWDAPEGHPEQGCVHLYASLFYRRLSPPFQFSPSAVTLVSLSQVFYLSHVSHSQ